MKSDSISAIRVIEANWDLGANKVGASLGPKAIRQTDLMTYLKNLGYIIHETGDMFPVYDFSLKEDKKAFLATVNEEFTIMGNLVFESILSSQFPLILGGDHSVAIASISGIAKAYRALGKKFGIVWFDAHADMNTPESSPSGNIHGMPVSALLGNGFSELVDLLFSGAKIEPKQIILVGIRDVDQKEQEILDLSGVVYYTMRQIKQMGVAEVGRRILDQFSFCDALHISLDFDGIDPLDAPGVSTPVEDGLRVFEIEEIFDILSSKLPIGSADFVELNPKEDFKNKTAELLKVFLPRILPTVVF